MDSGVNYAAEDGYAAPMMNKQCETTCEPKIASISKAYYETKQRAEQVVNSDPEVAPEIPLSEIQTPREIIDFLARVFTRVVTHSEVEYKDACVEVFKKIQRRS